MVKHKRKVLAPEVMSKKLKLQTKELSSPEVSLYFFPLYRMDCNGTSVCLPSGWSRLFWGLCLSLCGVDCSGVFICLATVPDTHSGFSELCMGQGSVSSCLEPCEMEKPSSVDYVGGIARQPAWASLAFGKLRRPQRWRGIQWINATLDGQQRSFQLHEHLIRLAHISGLP